MSRTRWRWVAVAVSLVLLTPSLASASRKRARRTLPAGVSASDGPARRAQVQDPAVSAAVERLRATRGGVGPTRARAAGDGAEGDLIVRSTRGHVTALSAPADAPFIGTRRGSDPTPAGVAHAFLSEHREAFGWSRARSTLHTRSVRSRGARTFVRFEQRVAGIPVFGAGVVSQVAATGGIAFVLADLARDDSAAHSPAFPTEPVLGAADAEREALDAVFLEYSAPDLVASSATLMVYEPEVIGNPGPARLIWLVRVRNAVEAVDEFVLLDAITGDVALQYSNVKDAKNRTIYDLAGGTTPPPTPARAEGDDPVVSPDDVNDAYDFLGDTYDFYAGLGRDSFDDAGAELIAHVRYSTMANAYWDGSKMVFGPGYAAADDVVAHELTHAVTENESNLIYWSESGAINEALSDIFGEFIDLTNSAGSDGPGDRWLVGEDLPGGIAIRNMADPTSPPDGPGVEIPQPDRRFSPWWHTTADDNRGVHVNSGVANKLAYLLTDGGSFNGETVAAQGIPAVAGLFYEAQVNLLVPGSNYVDLFVALRQAAVNEGWDAGARSALAAASRAVEIHAASVQQTMYAEDFEGGFPGSWTVTDQSLACGPEGSESPAAQADWGLSTFRASSGTSSLYAGAGGASPAPVGGNYKPCMDTWLVYGPFSLTDAQNAWAEFDLYLDIEPGYGDDIFWGVSIDGATYDGWAVQPPNGCTGPCLGPDWVREMFNFEEITEETILGQPQVWLAFNFASDEIVEYEGAYLDNVEIKQAFDPVVNVTSANGGESWPLDSLQLVTWTSQRLQPSHSVKISLVDGGTPTEIATVPYTQTSYVWKVAGSVTSTAKIRVECVGCAVEIADESDADFSLTPAVTVPVAKDFNYDGQADLLFRETTMGSLYTWLLNGTTKDWGSFLSPGGAPPGWFVAGVADFNEDGKPDLLWREQASGYLYVWFMEDLAQTGGGFLTPALVGTDWKLAGIGDFNGDDRPDLLWREQISGFLYVWYMNGLNKTGGEFLDPAAIPLDWTVQGLGDFNGDGETDIVWREQASGSVYVWYMNGAAQVGGSFLAPSAVGPEWEIESVLDMNGDEQLDLVWREQTGGYLYAWFMNGVTQIGGMFLSPNVVSMDWSLDSN